MNALLLTLTLLVTLVSNVSAQKATDSVYVVKSIDDMSDKVYHMAHRKLVVANDKLTKGAIFTPLIVDNGKTLHALIVTMVGIGGCNEDDKLIILFKNGEKIKKTSWNNFNCKGTAYFNLKYDDIELLKNQPIKKIKVTNGRSYDSYTGVVDKYNQRFFIQIFKSMANGNYPILTTEE